MRSQAVARVLYLVESEPEPPLARVDCSACGRSVESDVLDVDELLAVLGWARIDGQVLCIGCRRTAGRPADLLGRILART